MSDEYIKREDAIVAYANHEVDIRQGKFDDYHQYMRNVLRSVESVNVEEVVRCKDCKFAHMTYGGEWYKYCDMWESEESLYLDGDFFCAFGERRDDETN